MHHLAWRKEFLNHMTRENGSSDPVAYGNGSTNHTKLGNGSVDHPTSENDLLDHRTMGLGVRDITQSETGSVYQKTLENSSLVNHLRLTTRFKSYEETEEDSFDHKVMKNGSVNDTRLEKGLIITNKTVTEVIQETACGPGQGDPFYVLDLGDVIQKVEVWRVLMPRVKIFYAVKCNDTNTLLETLAILGTGFDCASKREIKQVLGLGVSPSRIIYAHPCKSDHDLRYASKVNVPLMTFDSPEELATVKKCYPEAVLVLRIRSDALKSTYKLGGKYGASTKDTKELLSTVKDLGLDVVGVSFHVGSDCQEPEAYSRAIAKAKKVFDEAEALGMRLTLLDIGGGFPGRISNELENFALVINSALDEHFPLQDHKDLKIIGEPGRYIATSAFTLATSIRARKTMVKDGQVAKMYYINDGVYGSFSEIRFVGEIFYPVVLNKVTEKYTEQSMIWGPTCCSRDIVKRDICLPSLECGDWLYWPDMGAYTMVFAGPFNGFPKPTVRSMASPEVWSCLKELSEKYIPSAPNKSSLQELSQSYFPSILNRSCLQELPEKYIPSAPNKSSLQELSEKYIPSAPNRSTLQELSEKYIPSAPIRSCLQELSQEYILSGMDMQHRMRKIN